MPDHTGRRRRQSALPLGRMAALVVALAAIALLVTLPEPSRQNTASGLPGAAPTGNEPDRVATAGTLPDRTTYTPLLFLTVDTSIGTAPTRDGGSVRLVLVNRGQVTELRRHAAADQPQFNAFAVSGDTVVWAESLALDGADVRTSLWRTNWRTAAKPWNLTVTTGEPDFTGGQYDIVVHAGTAYWTSAAGNGSTEVRSVSLSGGSVAMKRLSGEFVLTAWPWAVSLDGGRGKPVRLVNYETNARISLATTAQETATCSPVWCRVGVLGEGSLARLELVKPDGSGRRRIAGSEATPSVVDVALLDRYVPLTTDRGHDSDLLGVGLSLYDVTTGQTDLIATDVDNVRGNGAMLWWSSSSGDLTWYAVDLRALA